MSLYWSIVNGELCAIESGCHVQVSNGHNVLHAISCGGQCRGFMLFQHSYEGEEVDFDER